jgi:aspartate racemase
MKQNSKDNNRKIIVIGGGVGPMAGVDLHRLIIENTIDATCDQDHLRVIHLSFSDLIADRTQALKNHTTDIVAQQMASLIESIIPTCTYFSSKAVVGIPCNTFHAPPIFDQFINALQPHARIVTIINMIEETIKEITSAIAINEQIGIMSTTGTRESALYDNPLAQIGFHPIHCDDQLAIHSSIYNEDWGIKAINGESSQNREILYNGVEELYQKGAKAIILACTEIPLVIKETYYKDIPLINPVVLLAKAMIKEARSI